jgi:20S proteasome alpha/beta subunit
VGVDSQGPHLYEFSPTGNCFEYFAMAIGARSQSAKTYLELHYESFKEMSLDDLIVQGLTALRESLQQGKEVSPMLLKKRGLEADNIIYTARARGSVTVNRGTGS